MALAHTSHLKNDRKPLSVVTDEEAKGHMPRYERSATPHARLCPTPHLTVDQFIRLLACIDHQGGIATLNEICRALPAVAQPISAVLDLCDAGVLCADLTAAFDGGVPVWRQER